MDYAADYTARLKVHYTSMGMPHSAVWRIGDYADAITLTGSIGAAFRATIHNTDVVSRYEAAPVGSNVFLPVSAIAAGIGPGGRSGTLPAAIGLHMATQLTLSGRTAAGGKWKFVKFFSMYSEYDDFAINPDEWDTADLDFREELLSEGSTGRLVGNDGSPLSQVYTRMTVAVNDHYVALYRRTRAG